MVNCKTVMSITWHNTCSIPWPHFFFIPWTAFRLWEQESLHPESWSHQHPLWAQQRGTLQGHSYGEDRGWWFWWTSCFFQICVLVGSKWKRRHQHSHRDSHRQGPRCYRKPRQVWENWSIWQGATDYLLQTDQSSAVIRLEREKALSCNFNKQNRE